MEILKMLNHKQIEKLKANWGEKAEAMSCFAEVRVYDPNSFWECYIYSLNPEDEDEIDCIVKVGKDQPACVERWFLTNIKCLFNSHGEGVKVDLEYRPKRAAELFKKLNESRIYDAHRD